MNTIKTVKKVVKDITTGKKHKIGGGNKLQAYNRGNGRYNK